jgi:hypothetical protein
VGEGRACELGCSLVDELLAFVEGGAHVGGHGSGGVGDESDDEARRW